MPDNVIGKIKKLKAYRLCCHDDDHGQRVVFAETSKSARGRRGNDYCDCEYIDLRALRAPEFDECAPGPVTIQQYLDRGWHWECGGCHRFVYGDDKPLVVGDHVYHSKECLERDRRSWDDIDPAKCHESVREHLAVIDQFLSQA